MLQSYKFRVRTKSDKGKKTDYIWAMSVEDARKGWLATLGKLVPPSLPMVIDYAPLSAYDLKHMVENRGTETHFFSRANMKFAGDTMKNYGVTSQPVTIETIYGPALAWELYRRHPVKHGLNKPAYFEVETLRQCWPING